jgi:hypothetical protein
MLFVIPRAVAQSSLHFLDAATSRSMTKNPLHGNVEANTRDMKIGIKSAF